MLQRIQSLFLLGVVIIMALMSFLPIYGGANETGELLFKMGKLSLIVEGSTIDAIPLFYLSGLSAFSALLSMFVIFQFSNRKLQMRLTVVNLLVIATFMVLSYLMIPKFVSGMETTIVGSFSIIYYLGVLAIVLNSLARVFIKKDEDLVRSVDRLR